MRAICLLVTAVAAVIVVAGTAIAAEPVDLLLVLASDVSRSVDDAKFKLQRDGYIAAISNRRVIEAIRSGPHGRIAICFVEWSGSSEQKVVIGDAAARLRWSRLHVLSQDEEERGGVVNRGARDERSVRRLQAQIARSTGCLLGEAPGACGRRAGRACDCFRARCSVESKRVDEFANMSDEELRQYVYGTKELDS
jgi:hypothetical protein